MLPTQRIYDLLSETKDLLDDDALHGFVGICLSSHWVWYFAATDAKDILDEDVSLLSI